MESFGEYILIKKINGSLTIFTYSLNFKIYNLKKIDYVTIRQIRLITSIPKSYFSITFAVKCSKHCQNGTQMYKIYINDTPIFLTNKEFGKKQKSTETNLVALHRHRKSLFQYIDTLEKNHAFESITIYSKDLEQLKNDFFSIYKLVPAAGGAIFNKNEEVLMIFRRGFWDLPKGKLEKEETIEMAAVREVEEEVGLNDVKVIEALPTTYHTYKNKKGKRCLKPSYWFKMTTTQTDVVLQTEEDIEDSEWIKPADFINSTKVAYGSINDVLLNIVNSKK